MYSIKQMHLTSAPFQVTPSPLPACSITLSYSAHWRSAITAIKLKTQAQPTAHHTSCSSGVTALRYTAPQAVIVLCSLQIYLTESFS